MLTPILFFGAISSAILFAVLFQGSRESKAGKTLLAFLGAAVIVFSISGSVSTVYVKPFTGSGIVISKSEQDSYNSGRRGRYITPHCYKLLLEVHLKDSDISSICVPYSQWETVEEGDLVEVSYNKKKHKYWGNYLVGDKEPKESSNGKFKTWCSPVLNAEGEYIESKCDKIPESEYFKLESERNVRNLSDPEYVKQLRESKEESLEGNK